MSTIGEERTFEELLKQCMKNTKTRRVKLLSKKKAVAWLTRVVKAPIINIRFSPLLPTHVENMMRYIVETELMKKMNTSDFMYQHNVCLTVAGTPAVIGADVLDVSKIKKHCKNFVFTMTGNKP